MGRYAIYSYLCCHNQSNRTFFIMGQKLKHVGLCILRQKYLWTILAFIAIVGFLDPNSVWRLHELRMQNSDLEAEIKFFEDQYNADTKALDDLMNNPEAVERVARVILYMRTADEDVYVIE